MDYTKKIIYQSNYWYNDGLGKAQIRDMSGAITSLRRSLQYNRGNVAARNLLGLVYYGRGEVAEALVEWIISKNFQNRDNIANYFIAEVQESVAELETVNQAVKKFNQCLVYCEQNGEDLAIIQLKKVVEAHPTFLKAYQLLALCYLHTNQMAMARQVLRTARKLDTTNELTLRYMHELTQQRGRRVKSGRRKKAAVEYNVGNETIIQPAHSMAKELASKFTVMNLVVGAFIGAVIVWFLIVPAVNQSKTDKINKQIVEYSERINAMEAQISAQTRTLDEYRASSADSETESANAANVSESYENLMTVSNQNSSGNYSEDVMADALLNVNVSSLGASGQAMYEQLSADIFPTACQIKYNSGIEALNVANYDTAIDALGKTVRMEESYDNGGALLNLGIAYMRSGDNDNAVSRFKRVIELFAGTDYAAEAQNYIDSISQAAGTDANTAAGTDATAAAGADANTAAGTDANAAAGTDAGTGTDTNADTF